MNRREFITLLGGATAVWPLAARAEQAERLRKVGVLVPAAAGTPHWQAYVAAFREGLQKLGWSDGRNIHIEERWGPNADELGSHAAEFAGMAESPRMNKNIPEEKIESVGKSMAEDNKKRKPGRPPGSKNKTALVRLAGWPRSTTPGGRDRASAHHYSEGG